MVGLVLFTGLIAAGALIAAVRKRRSSESNTSNLFENSRLNPK